MKQRRSDDRVPGLILAAASHGPSSKLPSGEAALRVQITGYSRPYADLAATRKAPLLILDIGADDVYCISGTQMDPLPRNPVADASELLAAYADSIRRRHAAAARKQRFTDGFLTFVERLNRTESPAEAQEALLQQAPELMGVYATILLTKQRVRGSPVALVPVTQSRISVSIDPIPACNLLPQITPGSITTEDTLPGSPFAALAPLFSITGARYVVCVGIGERGLLLLIERRADREFGGEDWFRLQTIARHADRVLERLELLNRCVVTRSRPTPTSPPTPSTLGRLGGPQ